MATFNLGSAGNVQDLKQVKSYLYKLEEQLKYMFANLDPEENFDSRAKLIYAANAERQAALEVALEGITASYVTKDTLSQLALTEDEAALRYVNKDGIISEINASSEQVSINAGKITLNGYQEAVINSGFRVTADGKMHSVGGEFEGALTLGKSGNTGQLIVKDSNNAEIGRWDNAGISIKKGEINGPQITVGGNGSNVGAFVVRDSSNSEIGRWDLNGVSIKKGTITLGLVSGSNPARYQFSVDNNGNLKIGGTASTPAFEITNAGVATSWNTTSNHFVRMQSGKISAGVSTTERAEISLAGTLTDDTVTPAQTFDAIGIHSEATILAGSVWTTRDVTGSTGVKRGRTVDLAGQTMHLCAVPHLYYDRSQDEFYIGYQAVQLRFVNGLLVEAMIDWKEAYEEEPDE